MPRPITPLKLTLGAAAICLDSGSGCSGAATAKLKIAGEKENSLSLLN
jgi:hypothetical protein